MNNSATLDSFRCPCCVVDKRAQADKPQQLLLLYSFAKAGPYYHRRCK